ncbi:MAG: hypothetical protein ABL983_01725 [Nitrospira sp.]
MGLEKEWEDASPDLNAEWEAAAPQTGQSVSPITRQNASIAKPGTLEDDPDGPAHRYARPVLEALGMAGGAALSLPLGPIGAAAGGALGFAGGNAAASLLERLVGERPHIQSLKQAGQETLDSIKTGGLMEAGGAILGKVIPPVLAPFSKQFEGENKHIREMAEERGIKLDPHEVMQSRPIALGHKVLDNSLWTSGMIQRTELEKLGQLTKEWQKLREDVGAPQRQRLGEIGTKIQDTIEKSLDKIGIRQGELRDGMREDIMQQMGSPVTYKELGEKTQSFIKDLHKAKKDIEGLAWEHAREAIPEGARTANTNLKATAEKITKEYQDFPSFLEEPIMKQMKDLTKSGNPAYDRLVETIPQGLPPKVQEKLMAEITQVQKPGWDVRSLLKLRSTLSDAAAEHHTGIQRGDIAKGSSDRYGKIYTELIKSVDKDLEGYGIKEGSDLGERLKVARSLTGERASFFNKKENPSVMKALNSSAETLHKVLIQPGNAAGYTELKGVLGDTGVKPIKQAFTNHLMGEGGKGAEGLAGLRNTLDRYGNQTLAEVYSPQEIKDLYHMADKSQWMKKSPVGNPFFRELVRSNPSQVAPAILTDTNTTAKVLRQFPVMKPHLRQAFVDGVHPRENTPFPTNLITTLNQYPKEVQKQLFTHDELVDFHQLAKIIERAKGSVKLAENPSGTAQAVISATQMGMTLHHPLRGTAEAIGGRALTRMYLSKAGRKLLMEGLVPRKTAKEAIEIGTKIGSIIVNDEVDRMETRGKQTPTRAPITFDDEGG